jgi:hypothetical protein
MFSIREKCEPDQVALSPVQHQAQLLAALQARDLDSFSQLLQQFPVGADGACLESACRNADCAQFVMSLLQHGVDPNTLNPVLQKTPLHITAELGYYDILQVLVQDGRICIDSRTGSGQTALHVAVNKCGEACKEDVERYARMGETVVLLTNQKMELTKENKELKIAVETKEAEIAAKDAAAIQREENLVHALGKLEISWRQIADNMSISLERVEAILGSEQNFGGSPQLGGNVERN